MKKSLSVQNETENRRFCRKCMIPDYVEDKEEFLAVYLGQILPENRTDDAAYDGRLELCMKCEYYLNGMCRLCGCFVAIRAAHKDRHCPASDERW